MLLFLFLNSYFLTPAVIPIGIPNKEAKAEIEIHPVIVEAKIRKCSI